MQNKIENTKSGFGAWFQEHGPCAISENNAGVPIGVIDEGADYVTAYDKRLVDSSCL
jgi:hypothetical protein